MTGKAGDSHASRVGLLVQEDVDAAASVVQRRSPARPSMAPLSHSGSTVSQKGGGRTLRKAAEELADVAEVRLEGTRPVMPSKYLETVHLRKRH